MKRDFLRIGLFVFLIFCLTLIFNAKTTLCLGVDISCFATGDNATIHSKTSFSDQAVVTSAASESTYRSTTHGYGAFYVGQTLSATGGEIQTTNDIYKYTGSVDHLQTRETLGTEGIQAVDQEQVMIYQKGVGSGTFLREGEHHTEMAVIPLVFAGQRIESTGKGYFQAGAIAHNYGVVGPSETGGSYSPTGWDGNNVNVNDRESLKYLVGQHGIYGFSGTIELYEENIIIP